MKRADKSQLALQIWCILCLWVCIASLALADEHPFDGLPAYDFTDEVYREQGLDPDQLVDRLVAQDDRSVVDTSPDEEFTDIKILEITGGFNHKGGVLYYTINAKAMPNTFTDDAAGMEALAVANAFRAFIFPKEEGDPVGPGLANRRQDNVFDTRHGYFSNNPLGLWLLTFVSWDGSQVNTGACQEAIADLAEENGLDLDGTPVIKTVSDLESLEQDDCVRFRTRALDGSQGFPWVV